MKTAIILGTRPEIIKMSPLITELDDGGFDYFIIHTGQHYSYNMDRVFFEQLKLPNAKYSLEVGSGSHAEQTASILTGIEKVLVKEKPGLVLVQGDTNTVLGGALAASKLGIKVGHVEAGLRSYDRHMPEETNRVLTDHCSDYLFTPTENAKTILTGEGISEDKIFITGNTIVDAVHRNLAITSFYNHTFERLNLKPHNYFLVTVHRQENVDDSSIFNSIIQSLDYLASYYALPVIYPVHPRSLKRLTQFNIKPQNLKLSEPFDFFTFLQVEKNARLIFTDSGGVQEESCILGVPCITLRNNTERPETLDVGSNILAGTNIEKILESAEIMMGRHNVWKNPFGDGKASKRIVSIIAGGNDGQNTGYRGFRFHRVKPRSRIEKAGAPSMGL